ncbi:hypothetical protein KO500_02805 [Cellulophaga baltica]|uniref:hypothetical protein n=1 Tax=Cellulophaga TaxID=104264 RepID=UPI001C07E9B2|nr:MULTISPECIES: hypothetical protein [Cellulophaga]MBU2995341.1 hypothetical protein [Cellulophaga baltica]MDO6766736.1 hypothetical protein [Cellulophaga sp. 1_MG-2023]
MSKKMLSFIYLSVFILTCAAYKALTNKEKEENKEDAYSSVTNDNIDEENDTTYDYIILN